MIIITALARAKCEGRASESKSLLGWSGVISTITRSSCPRAALCLRSASQQAHATPVFPAQPGRCWFCLEWSVQVGEPQWMTNPPFLCNSWKSTSNSLHCRRCDKQKSVSLSCALSRTLAKACNFCSPISCLRDFEIHSPL